MAKKKEAELERFLAILPRDQDLGGLLECIFQAVQARKKGLQTAILVHENLQELARQSEAFDRIHLQNKGKLDLRLKRFKADVIFLADQDLKNQVKLLFSGAKIKMSTHKNALARFFPSYDMSKAIDRKRMAEFFQLPSEKIKLDFRLEGPLRPHTEPYVYLSLFDAHDSTNFWPTSYAPRLARLLSAKGVKLMVHVPATAKREDVVFLRRNGANLLFLDNLHPVERARHIQGALLFIGSPGPETALACALGRPVIFLSDMRAARRQNEEGVQSISRRLEAVFTQLVPTVDECINNCAACAFSSCLEYISPELVFAIAGEMLPRLNGHADPAVVKSMAPAAPALPAARSNGNHAPVQPPVGSNGSHTALANNNGHKGNGSHALPGNQRKEANGHSVQTNGRKDGVVRRAVETQASRVALPG